MSEGKALRALIASRRGDRNNVELAADAGGVPTQSRWQQITAKPIKLFPDPDTIRGMARALNVTVETVISACAKDLDLPMGGPDESALIISMARELPESSQQLIISVAREMLRLNDAAKTR